MSLAEYLAKNYLTADLKPEKKSKKRKRKDAIQSGLVIADDDALGWNTNGGVDADELAPLTSKSICNREKPAILLKVYFQSAARAPNFARPKAVIGNPSVPPHPRPRNKRPRTPSLPPQPPNPPLAT